MNCTYLLLSVCSVKLGLHILFLAQCNQAELDTILVQVFGIYVAKLCTCTERTINFGDMPEQLRNPDGILMED